MQDLLAQNCFVGFQRRIAPLTIGFIARIEQHRFIERGMRRGQIVWLRHNQRLTVQAK